MIEEARKTIYLLSMQVLSFVLLLSYSLGMDSTPILSFLLIMIEIALMVTVKKGFGLFILLWQSQLFLVAFVGIIFYPSIILGLSNFTSSVQIALAIAIIFIESVILIVYRLKEKGVIWVLKGSTISMIAVVLLVLLVIVSEGLPGLAENDPIKMLTTTDFAAYNQADSVTELNLSTQIDPYDFVFSTSSSSLHMAPNSSGSFDLSLSNTGALNDSYLLSTLDNSVLDVNISRTEVSLISGELEEVEVVVKSTEPGQYSLDFYASDSTGIKKAVIVQVSVTTSGFDLTSDKQIIRILNQQSSVTLIPLAIKNIGPSENSCILRVLAPEEFYPSLGLSEWSDMNKSALIDLGSGELRNFTLNPRQLTMIDGTYSFSVTATPVAGNQSSTSLNLTLIIESNKIISAVRPGAIPLSPGNATIWNISVFNQGVQMMHLNIQSVPQGLSVRAFVNGSTEIPIENGPIYLDQESPTNIQLRLVATNVTTSLNSSIEISMITPGSPLQLGILGFIAGSVITTAMALIVAVPLAIACAVFLSEYCSRRVQRVIKPVMETLAGIPSVIFGLWGALTFGPFLASTLYPLLNDTLGTVIPFFHGNSTSSGTILTASIVLGIMIFPIIMTLSYEAITAVPIELREGSVSLGATRWQTIWQITLKKAKKGIMGSVILGTGRALGETMAILMILGFTSAIPGSVFDTAGTMTSAIATTLTGVFSTTNARQGIFAIALMLFIFVLILNLLLVLVSKEGFWNGQRLKKLKIIGRIVELKDRLMEKGRSRSGESGKHDDTNQINYYVSSRVLERRDKIATVGIYVAATIILIFVAYIIGDILLRGGLAFKSTYLTETQLNGGFLNSITGSLFLVGVALAVAVPLTVLASLYIHEYNLPDSRLSKATYVSVSTLSSTPSIIFGAFGFIVFVLYLNLGFSLLSAGLTLACMILPLLFISNMDAFKNVPDSHREASYALGVSKWKTITGVILPSSLPAISSGIFIGIGRAIGETAAVLLTAGFIVDITTSIAQPVASMPVMIYNMFSASAGNPVKMQQVYAAAFLLIIMVIALNLIGKTISHYYQKSHYGSK